MKSTLDATRKVLRDAEAELRRFIGEAAAAADYESARRVSSLAEDLAALAARATPASMGQSPRPSAASRGKAGTGRATRRPRRARLRKSDYPRFCRHKDTLCKIGWSKKADGEYEQRIPRDAYDQIATAISSLTTSSGGTLTAVQILEHLSAARDADVPAYQVYIVLSLFRRHGLVEKQGRDGYRILDSQELLERSRGAWERVEERK